MLLNVSAEIHDEQVKSLKNFKQVEATLREKFPNTELFLIRIFLYSVQIHAVQLMEILQKKLKSAEISNSDTEPLVHGQYMWNFCCFASVTCLKTKEDLTLQMTLHKYVCPNAYLFKS